MEINSRTLSILTSIATNKGSVSVIQICNQHNIKKRTFYYDLNKCNDFLADNGIEKIELRNGKCEISDYSKSLIMNILSSEDVTYYRTTRERVTVIALGIGFSNEKLTLNDFSEKFDISKNTVLADFNRLREEAREKRIKLIYDSRDGYIFEGSESNIRDFLYAKFRESSTPRVRNEIKDLMNSVFCSNGDERDYWAEFRNCLMIYENRLGTEIIETDVENCVFRLAMSYIRACSGNKYQPGVQDKKVRETATFEGVKVMMQRISERMELKLYNSEAVYVTRSLLMTQSFKDKSSGNDKWFMEFTERYVNALEDLGKIQFFDRNNFINLLANHITAMWYRVGFEMQISNPLLDNITQNYKRELALARLAMEVVDSDLAERIIDDEIAYIVAYIISGVRKEHRKNNLNKILIVCAEGVATALMLQSQLEKLLANEFRYEITSLKRSGECDFDDYLMVISTLDSDALRNRAIKVNVVLTEDDEARIFDHLGWIDVVCKFTPYELISYLGAVDKEEVRSLTRKLFKFISTHRDEC